MQEVTAQRKTCVPGLLSQKRFWSREYSEELLIEIPGGRREGFSPFFLYYRQYHIIFHIIYRKIVCENIDMGHLNSFEKFHDILMAS